MAPEQQQAATAGGARTVQVTPSSGTIRGTQQSRSSPAAAAALALAATGATIALGADWSTAGNALDWQIEGFSKARNFLGSIVFVYETAVVFVPQAPPALHLCVIFPLSMAALNQVVIWMKI